MVLQPFIVLFSEIQYVSKTNKIVYYMVIAQEEKSLSEEASRDLLEVLGGSCVSGDKMEGTAEHHPESSVVFPGAGRRIFTRSWTISHVLYQ